MVYLSHEEANIPHGGCAMKLRKYMYGAIGFLSLLGFIGIYTEEKRFLLFFAFVVDFEYFFIKSDEMLYDYMNKSASRAFYGGMVVTAIVTLFEFFVKNQTGNEALSIAFSLSWSISIIIYALSTAYYGLKEKWELKVND